MNTQLEVFKAAGYVTDDGQTIPPHNLYRYITADGKSSGVRYTSIERAACSFKRKFGYSPL